MRPLVSLLSTVQTLKNTRSSFKRHGFHWALLLHTNFSLFRIFCCNLTLSIVRLKKGVSVRAEKAYRAENRIPKSKERRNGITLREETFAGRNFRVFADFGLSRESFFREIFRDLSSAKVYSREIFKIFQP